MKHTTHFLDLAWLLKSILWLMMCSGHLTSNRASSCPLGWFLWGEDLDTHTEGETETES